MSNPPLLLETIRLENGRLPYLPFHQQRLVQSQAFHYGGVPAIDLQKEIVIPEAYREGIYKLRMLYSERVERIDIQAYTIRPVRALQMLKIRDLDYAYKYADRQALQSLFDSRTYGDDVLLIRDGLLTDTSYANVALYDGHKWVTPAQPLLSGTARARYLESGLLHSADIPYQALEQFVAIKLINAMMPWEEGPVVSPDCVRWKN
jgi:4-amino-4-deoxychorismate lyase